MRWTKLEPIIQSEWKLRKILLVMAEAKKASGFLVPRPGIKPEAPALQGGLAGKPQEMTVYI